MFGRATGNLPEREVRLRESEASAGKTPWGQKVEVVTTEIFLMFSPSVFAERVADGTWITYPPRDVFTLFG
jgi:hypothetical protein